MSEQFKIELYKTALELARNEPYTHLDKKEDKFIQLSFFPTSIKIIYDELVSLFSEQADSES